MHGKEEHEHSGASSPKSGVSAESSKTVGSRLRAWTGMEPAVADELKEKIEELEVEREVEREEREEEREREDMKVVEEARGAVTPREDVTHGGIRGGQEGGMTVRMVLRSPGVGEVIWMKVVEGVGLCILRNTGYGIFTTPVPADEVCVDYWTWYRSQNMR